MQKTQSCFILLLALFSIVFFGCKTESKIQKLNIKVSGTIEHPITVSLGGFFPFEGAYNFMDTSQLDINYRFVPGEMLSINYDTTFYLFFSDSIIVDYRFEKPTFYSSNSQNTKYNQFYNDLSTALGTFYNRSQLFFLDKTDSIIIDENYIDNYLSKSDSLIKQLVLNLCDKYQFPQNTRNELLSAELQTRKLSLSYFYLGSCIPKLDSLGMLKPRLQYYIDKIDSQYVTLFSQKYISLLIAQIAYQHTQLSIGRFKSSEMIQNYYSTIQHFFTKGNVSYDYLISCLEVQAKKNKIKLRGANLRLLKQDAKKSIFRKFVEPRYNLESRDNKDSKGDKSLYDSYYNSTELSSIISQFKNKPLLIDFWASWCLPCLKKMPETIDYKKRYPNLNIVFISLNQSQDVWKSYLHEHNLKEFPQYRRNFKNQDKIFSHIQEIPKYGLLNKDGHIELFDELSDSLINKYCEKF